MRSNTRLTWFAKVTIKKYIQLCPRHTIIAISAHLIQLLPEKLYEYLKENKC